MFPVLVIAALMAMERTHFGEPRKTLPSGLCSGQIITVANGIIGGRISVREPTVLQRRQYGQKLNVTDVRRASWGTVVVERGHRIRVRFGDGRERVYDGPGPKVLSVVWSPDGHFVAYTYKFGPLGLGTACSDSYAVGILDLGTGTNYRLPRGPYDYFTVEMGERVEWLVE